MKFQQTVYDAIVIAAIAMLLVCVYVVMECAVGVARGADCRPGADCRANADCLPGAAQQAHPVWNDGHWWFRSAGQWTFFDEPTKRWISADGKWQLHDGSTAWTPCDPANWQQASLASITAPAGHTTSPSLDRTTPAPQSESPSGCVGGRCFTGGT